MSFLFTFAFAFVFVFGSNDDDNVNDFISKEEEVTENSDIFV